MSERDDAIAEAVARINERDGEDVWNIARDAWDLVAHELATMLIEERRKARKA